jgi:hypothetical protein
VNRNPTRGFASRVFFMGSGDRAAKIEPRYVNAAPLIVDIQRAAATRRGS